MKSTGPRGSGAIGFVARKLRALAACRAGQISTLFAIASVPIAMGIDIAVDFARASAARGELQSALDAAVLAGARDGTSSWRTVSANTFDAAVSETVNVASRNFLTDADGNYQGVATGALATSFVGLFSIDALTFQANATAVKPVVGNKVCILLNSTTASPGLLVNGGAKLNAPNCEVHVKSTGKPAATFNSGTVFITQKTCVAGSNVLENGGTHASPAKTCATVTDPFSGALPTPSSSTCGHSGLTFDGGAVTLSPGVYCNGINFNGTTHLTLAPGVYVIKSGNWNFNGGTMTGTGVTFYFPDTSHIQFNGTTSLNLSAPTSGVTANLLWYEAPNLPQSSFTVNATNGAAMTGLIWLPSRNLTLNSGASVISNKLTMVLNTLIMNTVDWTLASSDKPIVSTSGSAVATGIYLRK